MGLKDITAIRVLIGKQMPTSEMILLVLFYADIYL